MNTPKISQPRISMCLTRFKCSSNHCNGISASAFEFKFCSSSVGKVAKWTMCALLSPLVLPIIKPLWKNVLGVTGAALDGVVSADVCVAVCWSACVSAAGVIGVATLLDEEKNSSNSDSGMDRDILRVVFVQKLLVDHSFNKKFAQNLKKNMTQGGNLKAKPESKRKDGKSKYTNVCCTRALHARHLKAH